MPASFASHAASPLTPAAPSGQPQHPPYVPQGAAFGVTPAPIETKTKEKKPFGAGKVAALIVAASLVGGAAGLGTSYLGNTLWAQPPAPQPRVLRPSRSTTQARSMRRRLSLRRYFLRSSRSKLRATPSPAADRASSSARTATSSPTRMSSRWAVPQRIRRSGSRRLTATSTTPPSSAPTRSTTLQSSSSMVQKI